MDTICYNCFKEYDGGGRCPFCGYRQEEDAGKYPVALPQGSVLAGRYLVGRPLGQGGFGITYLAQDYQKKEIVAIKEYYPETLATRTHGATVSPYTGDHEDAFKYGRECFLSEAKTLAEFIGSPNIVRVYSYFEENGTAYFAMERIDGISLLQYLKEHGGKIGFEEAKQILSPVFDALGAVHAKGIVHRDVSPDNIFIARDGTVKLIDFGAARYSIGDRSRSLDVVLKHGYAPKEQYTRRGKQGAFTDVYSLAATMYRCITGRIPPDSIDRIEEDELIAPSVLGCKLSAAAEDALLKAMAVNPGDRYQSVAAFKAAVMELGTGEGGGDDDETTDDKTTDDKVTDDKTTDDKTTDDKTTDDKITDDKTTDDKVTDDKTTDDKTTDDKTTDDDKEQKKKRFKDLFSGKRRWIALGFAALLSVLAVGIVGLVVSGSKASKRPASAPVDEGSPNRDIPAVTAIATAAPTEPETEAPNVKDFEYTVSGGKVTITGYKGTDTNIVIPAKIEGKPVTAIDRFIIPEKMRSVVKSVSIPNGVKTIGYCAFFKCSGLTDVSIPASVTEIGEAAFQGCSSLSEVDLPYGIEKIGKSAFEDCSALRSVSIPDSVMGIGESAFWGCSSLSEVRLPNKIETIQKNTFWDCTSLKTIVIPKNVASIGEFAFNGCTSLENATILDPHCTIADTAFYKCSSLKNDPAKPAAAATAKPTAAGASGGKTERIDVKYGADLIYSIDVSEGIVYKTSADRNGFPLVSFYDEYNLKLGQASGYSSFGKVGTLHIAPTRDTWRTMAEGMPDAEMLVECGGMFLIVSYPTDVQWDMNDANAGSKYQASQKAFKEMLKTIK